MNLYNKELIKVKAKKAHPIMPPFYVLAYIMKM